MDIISTPRLRLRPIERSDLRALHALYADPELMRFITGKARTPWETRERLNKDLSHHDHFGFGLCIAEWHEDHRAIGRCGLEPVITSAGLEGEAAWMFAKPWWGLGLAAEAGEALLSYGLGVLGLSRIFAVADKRNAASIRVMQKLGMSPTDDQGNDVVFELMNTATNSN
ncbi:MAG: GNAT family N-acetyltransferase [Longimicrobiales bacterium]